MDALAFFALGLVLAAFGMCIASVDDAANGEPGVFYCSAFALVVGVVGITVSL